MKRKVKPGHWRQNCEAQSLIVNYEAEVTVLGDYGAEATELPLARQANQA